MNNYDVVICGGGLAGLCLARQLVISKSDLKIVIIDSLPSDIPKSAWKVGESSVELGAYYLRNHLQLGDYLEKNHIIKRGLRFFFDASRGQIDKRPEFGSSTASPFMTYQLDRGILESDLRSHVKVLGVKFLEESKIIDIEISPSSSHTVSYQDSSGNIHQVSGRWLVDATGRRRLIQKKLGLTLPSKNTPHSSAWFRVDGLFDVDGLVEKSNQDWHQRVPNSKRHLSTNHFVGEGYWVWVIPLSGNATSIGIVINETIHKIESINSQEKSIAWLNEYEPVLGKALSEKPFLDFRCLKHYSYSSSRVFSGDRWACVGEAAVFADPFYSPGLDFIAMTNTITSKIIEDDFNGVLQESDINIYSKYMILLNDQITKFHQHGYNYFPDELVTASRVLWDVSAAWGYMCLMFFNNVIINPEKSNAIRGTQSVSYFTLASKAYALFDEWFDARKKGMGEYSYQFFDYLSLDWLLKFRKNNLCEYTTNEELAKQYQENMFFYQALIMALFYLALDDVRPDKRELIKKGNGLKIQNLSLNSPEACLIEISDPNVEKYDPIGIYQEIKSRLLNIKDLK